MPKLSLGETLLQELGVEDDEGMRRAGSLNNLSQLPVSADHLNKVGIWESCQKVCFKAHLCTVYTVLVNLAQVSGKIFIKPGHGKPGLISKWQ